MKTKSTVGRLLTHLSEWRESGARVAAMLLLMTAGTTAAMMASDWVLNEDKYNGEHYTDHLYLEVFLADLDRGNTYCKEGTLRATDGSRTIDLMELRYVNQGDDESQTAQVYAKLLMSNAKAWFTNSSGSDEITSSEKSYWLYKWGSDNHYMTAKLDLYYSAEMAGGTWKIYFRFKHSNGDWYTRVLRYSVGTSTTLGLSDYNWKSYEVKRSSIDKMTFTVPKLPSDVPNKVNDIRARKATYDVRYTFYKQDGSTVVVDTTYEATTANEKKEELTFPDGVGNPSRIDCNVSCTHGVKDPSKWFNQQTNSDAKPDGFWIIPTPGAITMDYRQFAKQTALTWTSPSGSNYTEVTPYIYRVETDAEGNAKSGKNWTKRGSLGSTNGGAMSFTDDGADLDTYYQYMVVNVPTDLIDHGISDQSLNTPSDDLLSKIAKTVSGVLNTEPQMSIYNLQQDTTDTTAGNKHKVRLTWRYTRVPSDDASATFKVMRRTSEDSDWSEIGTVSVDAEPNDGTVAAYSDETLPNSVVLYQYQIWLEMGKHRFKSGEITAGLLQGTRLKDFTATQGTHDGSVTLTWSAEQAGTANCTYIISRRYINSEGEYMQVYTHNGADEHYTWEDNTVKPGYYYEYKIEVYDGGLLQNTLNAVGFCQARGTVSGRVNFGSGTAVPDVRLWLRPSESDEGGSLSGSSQYVHGASEGIAWKADSAELAKLFGSDKDYTVQFFVRPDAGLSEGAVVANIPGAGEISFGSQNARTYTLRYKVEKVTDLSTLTADYIAQDGDVLTGTLAGNYKISIADGAAVQLRNVTINGAKGNTYQWAGINCPGDATIVLKGNNILHGFHDNYPGIHIAEGKTLTVKGTGSLSVAGGYGCGIGGGYGVSCGNINIESGTINVSGTSSPGIGAGNWASCGSITIGDATTIQVADIGGDNYSIGIGHYQYNTATLGVVTIGGVVYWDGSHYQNNGDNLLTVSSYSYTGTGVASGKVWTTTYEYADLTGVTLPAGEYSQLTLGRTGNQLSVQVDTAEVKTFTISAQDIAAPFSLGGASGVTADKAFKGNFAEVRVFDHVLSDTEKRNIYDRRLNGREAGLVLYWPLDEDLARYAFDASYANDLPNGRHATMGANITPSAIVPAETQLARYGLTNDKGEYIIRGIPFLGSGSTYTIVPEKGIHTFNPKNRSLFISPSSLTANNIDFEDVSSFPMTGHIYYAGTNIPAEGIQLYVDGTLLTANGKVQQTDENGYYSISVPIGEHYVEAKLEDAHKMVDGGRFPIEGTHNFVDRVQHDFIDSTLVSFVGRVAGAKYNDTIPVGFGESKNNIGTATITLKLNNESFSFNCKDDYITPADSDRYYYSDTVTVKSRAWTGSKQAANTKYIYITTDSATGEFCAKLPPLKYVIKSIVIGSNEDIEFNSLPEVDLTNPKQTLTDSIMQVTAQGDTVVNSYKYNTKKVFTWYAQPQMDVVERKHVRGAFGLDSLIVSIDETTKDTIRGLYTVDSIAHYQFGYPIYQMLGEAEYELHGFEAYINKDYTTPVTDTVNLNGQELTIGNEMSAEQYVIYSVPEDTMSYKPGEIYQMKHNKVILDKNGRAYMPWVVGAPNIVSPFTRQFNITLKRDNRTYEVFRMDAIVLGELTTGNNFVTKGPDQVQFILRDPYGAHSKTTLKTGTVQTVTKYNTSITYGEHSLVGNILGGVDITVASGLGVMMLTGNDIKRQTDIGVEASWQTTHRKDSIYETTTIESISTSDKSPYVGAKGDVYVGTAKNILIGTCRKVHPKKNVEGKYQIVLEDALAMGQKINTAFAYSQYELETVMIPKWRDQRKQFLTQVASEQAARSYVNNTSHIVYLTWLDLNDPHCGDSATYVRVAPQTQQKDDQIDSVEWCNNQIEAWEKWIRINEEAKVHAQDYQTPKNYSIDGGTSRTFTFRNDTTKIDQNQTTYKIGAVLGEKFGFQYRGFVSFGAIVNFSTKIGGGSVSGTGDDTKDYTEWEYVLSDGNRDVDLSINMYKEEAGNHSKIFTLFGGQTYNPYEGPDSTHYYTDANGHHVPLGNGSVQMEQPYMSISKGNEAPGKSVTLTDIPAGQSATATLHCSNMSNTHQGVVFGYDVSVSENTDTTGLQILMDGVPINGRTIWTDQGTTVKKTITIAQTDESILDHEGIKLRFLSQYQPKVIYDEVTLNAHFKPSSSPVDLTVTNPVINTDPTTGNGKLSLKVSGFNRQFKHLKNIGIQYRFAGSTQWTELYTWETSEKDTAGTSHTLMEKTGDLKLTVDMSDNKAYPEGEYEFRAFSTTPYDNENIQVFSEVTKVIKDMTLPRPLFTPAPANGILGIGEQLAVEFNEDIVPGYVGDKNVIITAKLNGRPIDHDVSLRLLPFGQEVQTVNPVFLSGNFSLEFWINMHDYGTILHQGSGDGNFALNTDSEGRMFVSVLSKTFGSKATLPKDKWIFIAMNYKAETMTFNMQAQYDETTVDLFLNEVVPMEEVVVVDYTEDNYLYLGPINANIHDLALYNIYRDLVVAGGDKYVTKDAYTYGLTNYWRMNEGHGFVAADTRRTHDFSVKDSWTLSNTNYALRTDSTAGASVDISLINTNHDESYAIEFWYQSSVMSVDTLFETDTMRLRFDTLHNMVLDYGTKTKTVAAKSDFPGMNLGWHHVALNVVRGQAASFYLDGKRTAVIAESDVPVLHGAKLNLIKGGKFAFIDELRIWKATLSEERLLSNMYNTLDTADIYARGLRAYYPFEKDSTINGNKDKGETLQNMAPKSKEGNAGNVKVTKSTMLRDTPPLKNAPSETRITAVPVASERKVVINLAQTEVNARDIEGTTLNVTLAEIHDLHGNISNPIKWTAYVQQNTLVWLKDSVNIYKKYGDDYTFDVNIENKGGQIEYYTVANMPEWLTLVGSGSTDDVQPLKTKTLRFAVNPLVPVNDYDITIGLQGNNEILEPLRIVMKVRGETPDWTVDPALYDHSMTVIGQVYIGGILMENSESLVAAFIGGECRGVAAPEQVRGTAYVTLAIYGQDEEKQDAGKPVSFRIWDASRGVAYTDAQIAIEGKDSTVIFTDGALVGNFDGPAIWTKSDKVEQLISVHENWNWIAFGVEPESQYCDILFADYSGWGILLKDTGLYIQSNGTQWKGKLKPEVNAMYKMKITRTPTTEYAVLNPQLSIRGRQLTTDQMPVFIEKGWNWVAYTPLTTKRVDVALAGVLPQKNDVIKSQTAVAIYSGSVWEGTLKALEPGHGYLYYSNDTTKKSFTYPVEAYQPNGTLAAPSVSVSGLSAPRSVSANGLNWFEPVDKHTYPSNMTMTIRLLDGEAVVDTCEIAAFVGGECRGAVRADEEGLYYLVIAGDGAGQAMTIKTVLDGDIVTIDNTLTFTSDDHIGTPWEPYIINLQKAEGIEDVQDDGVQSTKVYKIIQNQHVFIIRNGEKYTITGQEVK